MTDDGQSGFGGDGFAKFFAKRAKERKKIVAERRSAEAEAMQAVDGRISSTVNLKGLVQLNVRVPVDVKNQVLEERKRRKLAREEHSDVGDIVSEAIRAYLTR